MIKIFTKALDRGMTHHVTLVDGEAVVGYLTMRLNPIDAALEGTVRAPWADDDDDGYDQYVETASDCAYDLEKLAPKHLVDPKRAMVVALSDLHRPYREKGLGVRLYLAAARVAKRHGYALAAGACMAQETSVDARRVWSSRRFARRVDVGPRSGIIGVYRGDRT